MSYNIGGPGITHVHPIAGAGPYTLGAVAITFGDTNQTAITVGNDGKVAWVPENEKDDTEFWAFRKLALPPGQGSIQEAARVRENGTPKGGTTSNATRYGLLVGGPVFDNGLSADRKLTVIPGVANPAFGGFLQKAGDPSKPAAPFDSFAPDDDITITMAQINAILDPAGNQLYEAIADITYTADLHFDVFAVPKFTA